MDNHKIITISREYGSGGRDLGIILSDMLAIPFYDNSLISFSSNESGYSEDFFHDMDKSANNSLMYSLSKFGGSSSANGLSLNDNLFDAQFKAIQKLAESGSCIIVGRCGDYILKNFPNCTRLFIYADPELKVDRVIKQYKIPEKSALDVIKQMDKRRANYYNHHTGRKWGHANNYHLCINTGNIDIECAAKIVVDYIYNKDNIV